MPVILRVLIPSFLIRVGRRVARSAVFHKRLAGSSQPSGPQRRCAGDTKSQIDTPIIKAADVHQVRRPPVAEQPDRGRKHDGRADHAEQTAQPLPMTEPTQRVRREGQRGKQRQQAVDEQSLVLAQEAQPDGRAEAGEGWKAGGAAHRGNDAAERAGFIGNACHQSHEAALAVVVGLLAHCLTLDG